MISFPVKFIRESCKIIRLHCLRSYVLWRLYNFVFFRRWSFVYEIAFVETRYIFVSIWLQDVLSYDTQNTYLHSKGELYYLCTKDPWWKLNNCIESFLNRIKCAFVQYIFRLNSKFKQKYIKEIGENKVS